jgi:hypothetical protein
MNILYVPLDERPCNYRQPLLLAGISDEITLLVPPMEHMGRLKKPADVDALWEWLFEHADDCDYAILSIDTLVYGNIINSRIHHLNMEECGRRLARLVKLKEINPKMEIHAFNIVARVANCDSDNEDPDYWRQYGTTIWQYAVWLDKQQRGILSADEVKKLAETKNRIPVEILDDFLARREVDRSVNLGCLEYLKEGLITSLVMPKDDNAEYGYAAMDHRAVAEKIFRDRLMDRVMIYPGADEVGSVMLARVFNRHFHYTPRVYTRYSSTLGPTIVPRYEDRPLNEGIKAQITSMGGICTETPQDSDFLFAVNSPGKEMIECGDQFLKKDISYYSYANPHEFINYISYYMDTFQKPVAIADVVFSNGADNEFMMFANKAGILERAAAYGGWNTSENTNGMCLAHAAIASYYEKNGWKGGHKNRSNEFLLRKVIEDWLFQANMLYQLMEHKDAFPGIDPYHLDTHEEKVRILMLSLLRENIKNELNDVFMERKIEVSNLTLPWSRIFDIDFDISLA